MSNEIMSNIKHIIMISDVNEKMKLDMLDYLCKLEYNLEKLEINPQYKYITTSKTTNKLNEMSR
jgi:hypothetical protein